MSDLNSHLQYQIDDILSNMERRVFSHFRIYMTPDEVQRLLVDDEEIIAMIQRIGKLVPQANTFYQYPLGKCYLNVSAFGSKSMPNVILPKDIVYSEALLELIKPLYQITKTWVEFRQAFAGVCRIVQNAGELNFYAPWLPYIIPDHKEFLTKGEEYTANFIGGKHNTFIAKNAHKQIKEIIKGKVPNKRIWVPTPLVKIVRTGEELITQYNLLRTLPIPKKDEECTVEISIVIKQNKEIEEMINEGLRNKTKIKMENLAKMDARKFGGNK